MSGFAGKLKLAIPSGLPSAPYRHLSALDWVELSESPKAIEPFDLLSGKFDLALISLRRLAQYDSFSLLPWGIYCADSQGPMELSIWQGSGPPELCAVWAFVQTRASDLPLERLQKEMSGCLKRAEIFARDWAEDKAEAREQAQEFVRLFLKLELDENIQDCFQRELISLQYTGLAPPSAGLDWFKPGPLPRSLRPPSSTVDRSLSAAAEGNRLSVREAAALGQQANLSDIALAAESRRHSRVVTYSLVHSFSCLEHEPGLAPAIGLLGKKEGGVLRRLSTEEIELKLAKAIDAGGRHVVIRELDSPELGLCYYEDLLQRLLLRHNINISAFSFQALENICRAESLKLIEVLQRLRSAGLYGLAAGPSGVEIDSLPELLKMHRTAHAAGLASDLEMTYDEAEPWLSRFTRLELIRAAQDEGGGFRSFAAVPAESRISSSRRLDPQSCLRMNALSKLFLDCIPSVRSSVHDMGLHASHFALEFGADSLGLIYVDDGSEEPLAASYASTRRYLSAQLRSLGFEPAEA